MQAEIQPLQVQSLKEACVRRLEELILSGQLKIGERLPSERDLAARLNVSRPLLHEALVDLTAKGLVTIEARRGVYVSDFRSSGSVALLSSLLSYHEGELDSAFVRSMLEMRGLLETETARTAALRHTPEQLAKLREHLAREAAVDTCAAAVLTELDFDFHLLVALASGNVIYPMIINSFKEVYTNLTGRFFRRYCGTQVVDQVLAFHARLVETIAAGDPAAAAQAMNAMLRHGEEYLTRGGEE